MRRLLRVSHGMAGRNFRSTRGRLSGWRWLLSFGADAEALAPAKLRKLVKPESADDSGKHIGWLKALPAVERLHRLVCRIYLRGMLSQRVRGITAARHGLPHGGHLDLHG